MRNDIASFEKTSSGEVKFWAKLNAKISSTLIFSIILTLLRLVFSKEAILFLIYLLADKAKHWVNSDGKLLFKSKEVHSHFFLKNVSNFHKKFNAKTPDCFLLS